jgi:hypothetical protein
MLGSNNRRLLMKQALQWRPLQLSLEASSNYTPAYTDVDAWIVFTHESGRKLLRPAFWNGGNSWCVRFSAPLPGKWGWTSHANVEDAGLRGKVEYFREIGVTSNLIPRTYLVVDLRNGEVVERGTLGEQNGWMGVDTKTTEPTRRDFRGKCLGDGRRAATFFVSAPFQGSCLFEIRQGFLVQAQELIRDANGRDFGHVAVANFALQRASQPLSHLQSVPNGHTRRKDVAAEHEHLVDWNSLNKTPHEF